MSIEICTWEFTFGHCRGIFYGGHPDVGGRMLQAQSQMLVENYSIGIRTSVRTVRILFPP